MTAASSGSPAESQSSRLPVGLPRQTAVCAAYPVIGCVIICRYCVFPAVFPIPKLSYGSLLASTCIYLRSIGRKGGCLSNPDLSSGPSFHYGLSTLIHSAGEILISRLCSCIPVNGTFVRITRSFLCKSCIPPP